MQFHLALQGRRGLAAAGAAALLALLPASPASSRPGAAEAQDPTRPTPPSREEKIARASERFEGVWQLVGGTLGQTRLAGGDTSGYLIVRPGYMSLEIHLVVRSRDARNNVPAFQSGMYRWRFVNPTRLEASCLIGNSNYNADNRWNFEPPGTKRSMVVALSDSTLTLDQGKVSKLQFRRVPELPYPGRQVGFEGRRRGGAGNEDDREP